MKTVAPGPAEGRIVAPPSKSLWVRALAAASLVAGRTCLRVPGLDGRAAWDAACADARAARGLIEALGARCQESDEGLLIHMAARTAARRLDCGESGLSLRLFSAIAALGTAEVILDGHGSLTRRPMHMIEAPLAKLGAHCATSAGHVPIRVRGPLAGGEVEVDGAETSQFLSGLLMALPLCAADSRIQVRALNSGPYVRLTLDLIRTFGVTVEASADLASLAVPGGQRYQPGRTVDLEGDWSGASAPLVAGALGGPVTVGGLSPDSQQADRALVDALRAAGARVDWTADGLRVVRGAPRAFSFDATDCPDLFPALVALAVHCPGQSVIAGAGRLAHKESDRARALIQEFGKLGARVTRAGDRLLVQGGPLRAARVESHGDHRIAMACAVGALGGGVAVDIVGADCVAKSYPRFFEDLGQLGVEVR